MKHGRLLSFWAVPEAVDPDRLREVRLLYGVTRPQIAVYAVSALLLALPGVTTPAAGKASVVLLVASAAAQLLGLALAHRGWTVAGARTVIATTLATAMVSVSLIGGLQGTLAATLVLGVLVAGVLRGWRTAAASAAFTAAYVLVQHAAERAGLAPLVQAQVAPVAAAVSNVAMLAIVAALLALYAREMDRAVDARRASDARTLETERALAEVVRSAPDGILVTTPDGVIESVNDAIVRMSGYAADELVGHRMTELPHIAGPEVTAQIQEALGNVSGHGDLILQLDLRRKDGSLIVVESNGRIAVRPDGTVAIQVVVRDVTARVVAERERQRLEEALLESRRMEGIGRLAGGIAHDFRNLLTPIIVNADAIAEGAYDSRALAGEIGVAAQHANALTGQLLAFARRQMLETKVLDLNAVVRGLEPILRRVVREDVRFDLRLASRLPALRADRSQLEQVVLNLVANACDAMPEGGHLLVATTEVLAPPTAAAGRPERRGVPVPHVALLVSDTGRGMSEEVRRRIFEPFFTTKEAGRGVGLGLATVHGIVTQTGGTVQVESEPGRGSTFRVLLPVADGAVEVAEAPAPVEPVFPPGLRVLVADDAPLVRAAVARALRSRGVEVIEAEDGLAALAAARADGGKLDLLVTDVVMPGLAGPALAAQLRRFLPEVAVLFISGYADEGVVAGGQVAPDVEFLPKPFTPAQLIARVAEALHRRRGGPTAARTG